MGAAAALPQLHGEITLVIVNLPQGNTHIVPADVAFPADSCTALHFLFPEVLFPEKRNLLENSFGLCRCPAQSDMRLYNNYGSIPLDALCVEYPIGVFSRREVQ